MTMRPALFATTLTFLHAFSPAQSIESVWIEGEAATSQSVLHNGWYASVKKDELSGGDWIAHWGNVPGSATYRIEIPRTDTYVLWLRANPVGTKLNVRFDGGSWFDVNFKRNQHETINVASDDKPDLRFIGWVRAGVRKFTAGDHEIEIRFNSGNNNHGALDCFCLTTGNDWKPRRTLRPGEAIPHWPAPEINDENLDRWLTFIRPSDEELGWRKVRWHHSLSEAAAEAKELRRPILLFAMNGHPCGET